MFFFEARVDSQHTHHEMRVKVKAIITAKRNHLLDTCIYTTFAGLRTFVCARNFKKRVRRRNSTRSVSSSTFYVFHLSCLIMGLNECEDEINAHLRTTRWKQKVNLSRALSVQGTARKTEHNFIHKSERATPVPHLKVHVYAYSTIMFLNSLASPSEYEYCFGVLQSSP